MLPDREKIQHIVRAAAREELLPRFNNVAHTFKHDGSIVTEADFAMHRRLKKELSAGWPDIDFLSEEMPIAQQEALVNGTRRPLWCLDPLDGTSNFAAGIPYFCVSLALIVGGEPALGVIYDPYRDELFAVTAGEGASLNGQALANAAANMPLWNAVALVDLKRLPHELRLRLVNTPPYRSQRNFGSAALEWSWLAAGRGHLYLHGGHKIWDLAVGSLLLAETGGHSMTLDGRPVFSPNMESSSIVAASDEALFRQWCAWLNLEIAPRSKAG
ncbi:MAG: inositol monophosphatase family protein [Gammaproteobacteria bacterium]